jgi:CRP-like cAMP-binding protein
LEAARQLKVTRGSYLFYQGDPADRLHVLLEGSLKLSQVTPDGQQVIMRYIRAGDAFSVLSVLDGLEYPGSAEAVDDCQILAWDRAIMKDLMRRYPSIALRVLEVVAGHVQEFQDRLRELSTERVERRIARALLRLASQTGRKTSEGVLVDLPLSRQDLAEMTGTTLYTVSRTLSQWEMRGLVHSSREKVVILQPHGLVAIAEDLPVR